MSTNSDNIFYFPKNVDVRTCPKNGHSSLKQFFINVTMKLDPNRKLKEEFIFYSEKNLSWRARQVLLFGDHFDLPFRKNSIRLTIKRDPIERFKSATEMLQAHVFHHYIDEKTSIENKLYHKFYTSVDQLLSDLENDTLVNIHFYPQTFYLGNNSQYDHVYDITEFETFQKDILLMNDIKFTDHWFIHMNYSNNSDLRKMKKIKEQYRKSKHVVIQAQFKHFKDEEKITSRMTENDIKRIKKLYEMDYDNGWC